MNLWTRLIAKPSPKEIEQARLARIVEQTRNSDEVRSFVKHRRAALKATRG